jgi:uncharacterized spore protein YtfJ
MALNECSGGGSRRRRLGAARSFGFDRGASGGRKGGVWEAVDGVGGRAAAPALSRGALLRVSAGHGVEITQQKMQKMQKMQTTTTTTTTTTKKKMKKKKKKKKKKNEEEDEK